jgi:hypothetical protein
LLFKKDYFLVVSAAGAAGVSTTAGLVVSTTGAAGVSIVAGLVVSSAGFLSPELLQAAKVAAMIAIAKNFFIVAIF